MFERFTDRARKVMALADQQTRHYKHDSLGSLHVLLGMVKEGEGEACTTFKNLKIDLGKIHQECEKRLKRIKIIRKRDRAEEVINSAIEVARSLNYIYVGTEHLLLGILLQEKSRAAQILRNLGLKTEDVQKEILSSLGAGEKETVSRPSLMARRMVKETEKLASVIASKEKPVKCEFFQSVEKPVKCEFFQSVETVMMEGEREDTYFKPAINGYGRDDVEKKITDFLKDKEFVHSNQSSLVILGKYLIRTTEYTIFYRDKE